MMARNLDLTALRAFATVAETGGVTRAATLLNLTQSAVSMQLKRLEEGLGMSLLDRSERTIRPTSDGEQLLTYARKMLELNDEALGRLTSKEFEGELVLGVPHDIVYPVIPQVMRQFSIDYPRIRIKLVSSFTRSLLEQFNRGELDVLLTTEASPNPEGQVLELLPLIWVGAPMGSAWKQRPLPLGHETHCFFRSFTQEKLDQAGIPWKMAVDTDSTRPSEAAISADLAVMTLLEGSMPDYFEKIEHGGALPDLPSMYVNMYLSEARATLASRALATMIRDTYSACCGSTTTLPVDRREASNSKASVA